MRDRRYRCSSKVKFVFEIFTSGLPWLSDISSEVLQILYKNQKVWTSASTVMNWMKITWVGLGQLFLTFNLDYLFICKCCLSFLPHVNLFCQTFAFRIMMKMPLFHYWSFKAKTWSSKCHLNAENVSLPAHHLSSFIERLPVTVFIRP